MYPQLKAIVYLTLRYNHQRLQFVTATSKEDQLKIQALEKNHLSKDEFILAWLDYKGMPEEKAKYQSLIEPERSYHVG